MNVPGTFDAVKRFGGSVQPQSAREAAEDASIAEARARGRKLMEPDEDDEDLKMPAGQKMVLGILVVVVMLLMQFLGGR